MKYRLEYQEGYHDPHPMCFEAASDNAAMAKISVMVLLPDLVDEDRENEGFTKTEFFAIGAKALFREDEDGDVQFFPKPELAYPDGLEQGQEITEQELLVFGWVETGMFFPHRGFRTSHPGVKSFEKPEATYEVTIKGKKYNVIPAIDLNLKTGIVVLSDRIDFANPR